MVPLTPASKAPEKIFRLKSSCTKGAEENSASNSGAGGGRGGGEGSSPGGGESPLLRRWTVVLIHPWPLHHLQQMPVQQPPLFLALFLKVMPGPLLLLLHGIARGLRIRRLHSSPEKSGCATERQGVPSKAFSICGLSPPAQNRPPPSSLCSVPSVRIGVACQYF